MEFLSGSDIHYLNGHKSAVFVVLHTGFNDHAVHVHSEF